MIDFHVPGDKVWNDMLDKSARSEKNFKWGIDILLRESKIKFYREQEIYKGYGSWNKWSLLADFASWPHKGWLIECKRKADISSCSKALGQCLMYRAMAKYEHPIICFPSKEYYTQPCVQEFEKVCKAHNVEVAHEESILKIIQHYESIYTISTNPELRTVQDGGQTPAVA